MAGLGRRGPPPDYRDAYFGPEAFRPQLRGQGDFSLDEPLSQDYKVQRPNTLPRFSHPPDPQPHPKEQEDEVVRNVNIGVTVATLITENLLSHPFVVLKRQCQVNHNAHKYHLTSVTLVPVIIHLHQRQGFSTLWKGIGSILLVRGMNMAVEDLISKLTSWPKEWPAESPSWKVKGQHVLLKCISLVLITPFYSSSLVETVQSDIASETHGVFDVIKEGLCRLLSWSTPQRGRMLPVWALAVPTVCYGLMRYSLHTALKEGFTMFFKDFHKKFHTKNGAIPKTIDQDIDVNAQVFSAIGVDCLLYPMETILHRLHLQGTRTIIDNLDNGYTVTPILTSYDGLIDCYRTTVAQEGFLGLYKGFGALMFQFMAYYGVIKLTKLICTHLHLLRATMPPQMPLAKTPLTPRSPFVQDFDPRLPSSRLSSPMEPPYSRFEFTT